MLLTWFDHCVDAACHINPARQYQTREGTIYGEMWGVLTSVAAGAVYFLNFLLTLSPPNLFKPISNIQTFGEFSWVYLNVTTDSVFSYTCNNKHAYLLFMKIRLKSNIHLLLFIYIFKILKVKWRMKHSLLIPLSATGNGFMWQPHSWNMYIYI